MALTFIASTGCGSDTPATLEPVAPVAVVVNPDVVLLIRLISPTKQLSATVTGASNGAVTYSSMLPGVVTVSPTGFLTAVTDGYGTIVVTSVEDPSKKAYVAVNVVSTIVTTNPTAVFMTDGLNETRQVTSTVKNNPNTNVTWSSSNTAVATVSSTGLVSSVAPGTANIIATSVGDNTKAAITTATVDPAIPAGAIQLTNGTAVDVAGAAGSDIVYYIAVPANKTNLKFEVNSNAGTTSTGDVDIYVRGGRPVNFATDAIPSSTACYSWNNGNNESCSVSNPAQRIYYVTLDGYATYSNAKLKVTWTP